MSGHILCVCLGNKREKKKKGFGRVFVCPPTGVSDQNIPFHGYGFLPTAR